MAGASVWATSPLGVVVRLVICGFYLLFFPPGYVAIWDSKTPHRPAGERVSWCLETTVLRLPPWNGSLSLTLLSLFLSFIVCPTFFWRQWAAFLDAWSPLLAFRSCFVVFAQSSNDLLMKFVGKKVVSWSYSSAILGLPPHSFLYYTVYYTGVLGGISKCTMWLRPWESHKLIIIIIITSATNLHQWHVWFQFVMH